MPSEAFPNPELPVDIGVADTGVPLMGQANITARAPMVNEQGEPVLGDPRLQLAAWDQAVTSALHRSLSGKGNGTLGIGTAWNKLLAIAKQLTGWDRPTSLPSQSCAIVASGPGVVGRRLGAHIDAHDVVIRFNDAPVAGYELDVGTKTTVRLGFVTPMWRLARDNELMDFETLEEWHAAHPESLSNAARAIRDAQRNRRDHAGLVAEAERSHGDRAARAEWRQLNLSSAPHRGPATAAGCAQVASRARAGRPSLYEQWHNTTDVLSSRGCRGLPRGGLELSVGEAGAAAACDCPEDAATALQAASANQNASHVLGPALVDFTDRPRSPAVDASLARAMARAARLNRRGLWVFSPMSNPIDPHVLKGSLDWLAWAGECRGSGGKTQQPIRGQGPSSLLGSPIVMNDASAFTPSDKLVPDMIRRIGLATGDEAMVKAAAGYVVTQHHWRTGVQSGITAHQVDTPVVSSPAFRQRVAELVGIPAGKLPTTGAVGLATALEMCRGGRVDLYGFGNPDEPSLRVRQPATEAAPLQQTVRPRWHYWRSVLPLHPGLHQQHLVARGGPLSGVRREAWFAGRSGPSAMVLTEFNRTDLCVGRVSGACRRVADGDGMSRSQGEGERGLTDLYPIELHHDYAAEGRFLTRLVEAGVVRDMTGYRGVLYRGGVGAAWEGQTLAEALSVTSTLERAGEAPLL